MRKSVTEVMSDCVMIERGLPLDEAFALLVEMNATELCIVDDAGCLEGVVTDYELLKAHLVRPLSEQTEQAIESLMNRAVTVISPDVEVEQTLPLFRDGVCSRAFVCRNRQLLGRLTRSAVLRHLHGKSQTETEQVRPISVIAADGRRSEIQPREATPKAPQFLVTQTASMLSGLMISSR